MNPAPLLQIIGNLCAGCAALVFLFPLQRLLWTYASKYPSDDRWVTPTLFVLIPLWLLLLIGLLCVTATGGFDWLRLGRTTLYTLTVATSIALAAVSLVFIALYIRPGFTPRFLYTPVIYLIPLATVLLVVLSLNQKFTPGIPAQWLRWPWTIFAAFSLVACIGFFGYKIFRLGAAGVAGPAYRKGNPRPSSEDILAKIATLDPERHFTEILQRANRHESREVREAATARLRSHADFLELLSAELETGYVEPAVTFLRDAALTPEEQKRLAPPACLAMERWAARIPAPKYTTKKHLKDLRNWGTEMFRVLTEKFAGTGVDFTPVIEDFKDKVEAKP